MEMFAKHSHSQSQSESVESIHSGSFQRRVLASYELHQCNNQTTTKRKYTKAQQVNPNTNKLVLVKKTNKT